MSRSRRLPPLFEVMRETNPLLRAGGTVHAPPPPPPAPPVMRPPVERAAGGTRPPTRLNGSQILRPVPAESGQDADDGEGGGDGADAPNSIGLRMSDLVNLDRTFVIPARSILIGVGILVGILIVIWAIAHRVGESAERSKWVPRSPDDTAATLPTKLGGEPITTPPAPAPTNIINTKPAQPAAAPARSGVTSRGPDATPRIILSSADDPRAANFNYLYVVTVPRQEEAEGAANFLTQSGLLAAAVAKVDPDPAKAKNGPKWRVFVLEGIPSVGYKNSQRRLEIETTVKRLGDQWKKNPRGGLTFDSSGWEKFEPPAPAKPPR